MKLLGLWPHYYCVVVIVVIIIIIIITIVIVVIVIIIQLLTYSMCSEVIKLSLFSFKLCISATKWWF